MEAYIKYTSVEVDAQGDTQECAIRENKFEASRIESRCTIVAHYHTTGDVLKEEDVAAVKESIKKIFKPMEDYLLAIPLVYA